MGDDPLEVERISPVRNAVEVATDVVLAQPHSHLGSVRSSKPGDPERELRDYVHVRHCARGVASASNGARLLGITRLCGGKESEGRC